MIWFLVIVGFLIFAPGILLIVGAGIVAVAMPFLVFFAVWGIFVYAVVSIWPGGLAIAIIIGFVAGIVVARMLVKKTLNIQ